MCRYTWDGDLWPCHSLLAIFVVLDVVHYRALLRSCREFQNFVDKATCMYVGILLRCITANYNYARSVIALHDMSLHWIARIHVAYEQSSPTVKKEHKTTNSEGENGLKLTVPAREASTLHALEESRWKSTTRRRCYHFFLHVNSFTLNKGHEPFLNLVSLPLKCNPKCLPLIVQPCWYKCQSIQLHIFSVPTASGSCGICRYIRFFYHAIIF